MKTSVRYYTRSGNTKKLAKAIGNAINTEVKTVSEPLDDKVDVLFLGCSYYAFDVDEAVKRFLINNKDFIGKVVCFGTSAMMKSMKKPIKKAAKNLEIEIAEQEFHCRGQFGYIHKGRPNEQDLINVANFAKGVIED
ncbi:MAG: flavodoxin [Clostridia bacterium]|nr:flavodoxin [Clostridia bacterium]